MAARKSGRKGAATVPTAAPILFGDVRQLIVEARAQAASAVNATLARLHWLIGKRIKEEILTGERAEYGQEILATLSQQLVVEFGNGYSYSALTRMVKFVEVFPDERVILDYNEDDCRAMRVLVDAIKQLGVKG